MKKFIVPVIAAAMLAFAAPFAVSNQGSDHGYKKPVEIKHTGFKAVYKDGTVAASWKKYLKNDLKFYKLVRSANNANPIYPEDGYIFFSTDNTATSYTDRDIKPGTWHYRLCIITNDGSRWISPVVTIKVPEKPDASASAPTESDFE